MSSDSNDLVRELRSGITALATANVRLCDIAIAADKLAEAVRLGHENKILSALEDYQIVRQGS